MTTYFQQDFVHELKQVWHMMKLYNKIMTFIQSYLYKVLTIVQHVTNRKHKQDLSTRVCYQKISTYIQNIRTLLVFQYGTFHRKKINTKLNDFLFVCFLV